VEALPLMHAIARPAYPMRILMTATLQVLLRITSLVLRTTAAGALVPAGADQIVEGSAFPNETKDNEVFGHVKRARSSGMAWFYQWTVPWAASARPTRANKRNKT
jgi:hypothetical protein